MDTIARPQELGPSLAESIWKYRGRIIVVTVLAVALGFWISGLRAPSYTAATTMFLRDPSESAVFDVGASDVDPERYVQQHAGRLRSRLVLGRAAASLEGQTYRSLDKAVQVEANAEQQQIIVSATAAQPAAAANIANTVATTFEEINTEQNAADIEQANAILDAQIAELDADVSNLEATLSQDPDDAIASSRLRTYEVALLDLQTRASELAANAAILGSGIRFREQATEPDVPSSPQPLRDAALLGALAFAVASAVAYVRAGAELKMKGRRDPAAVLDAPLLGEIPAFPSLHWGPADLAAGSGPSEAYQFILSSVEFSMAQVNASSVLITSASAGDGKSSTAAHLAVASARQARRVTLVDADIRARGLTDMLGADEDNGLVELAGGSSLERCTRRYRISALAQLAFVPTGARPSDPTGLLRTPAFKSAMRAIRSEADLIIVDSPPVLAVADATILAAHVDAVVLVVDRSTQLEDLNRVKERLAFGPSKLLGYVYNRASSSRPTNEAYHVMAGTTTWDRLLGRLGGRYYGKTRTALEYEPAEVVAKNGSE